MARKSTTVANAADGTAAPKGPQAYRVKPGVGWIDGKRLKAGQTEVMLTDAAARFDLQHERIVEKGKPDPKSWAKPAEPSGEAD
ncbi:hypothetical protein [Aurantimonas coralicida]|uniref:hypothetical protein n=1 Tax=Aurantimonas coralicida TaxID=182270 RepID=UPI001E3175F9|nr:hypothetical protein [Aurantimonas coralicida]MCD1644326.1 hypothetical protein [Aurantimonas coralicida]